MSNASRIADLVQITNRLSDLLEHESAVLRARKLAEMETVRADKLTLSAAYETNVRAQPARDARRRNAGIAQAT